MWDMRNDFTWLGKITLFPVLLVLIGPIILIFNAVERMEKRWPFLKKPVSFKRLFIKRSAMWKW